MGVQMSLMEYYSIIGEEFELKIVPTGITEMQFRFDTDDYNSETTPLLDSALIITAFAFIPSGSAKIDYIKVDAPKTMTSTNATPPALLDVNSFYKENGATIATAEAVIVDGLHQIPVTTGTRVHPSMMDFKGAPFIVARHNIAIKITGTVGTTKAVFRGIRIPRSKIMPPYAPE